AVEQYLQLRHLLGRSLREGRLFGLPRGSVAVDDDRGFGKRADIVARLRQSPALHRLFPPVLIQSIPIPAFDRIALSRVTVAPFAPPFPHLVAGLRLAHAK